MKHRVFITDSVRAEQLEALLRQINNGDLNGGHIQAFLDHRDPFPKSSSDDGLPSGEQLNYWQIFLANMFGINISASEITIPQQASGFSRLIVVPAGITLRKVVARCFESFKVASDHDFLAEDLITIDDRQPTAHYAVWVKGCLSADEEFANRSANDLSTLGIAGITLLERLLYELKYFDEMHQHLERRSSTLCSGSRLLDGSVPQVYFGSDVLTFWINRRGPDEKADRLRTRRVLT